VNFSFSKIIVIQLWTIDQGSRHICVIQLAFLNLCSFKYTKHCFETLTNVATSIFRKEIMWANFARFFLFQNKNEKQTAKHITKKAIHTKLFQMRGITFHKMYILFYQQKYY